MTTHWAIRSIEHQNYSLIMSEVIAPSAITGMASRGLYHVQPPALQTKIDMNPTLLVSWWCTGFALAVILVRVCGRYVRTETLFREDKIMAASIIPLIVRMALVHVILIWGTNNTASDALSATDVHHRQIGSRLVLASRVFYAAFIWTAKLTVLEFLKRIVGAYWRRSYEIGLRVIRYFLLATFAAVVIGTLAECQPFRHYWQVVPDPGPQCREGVVQLLTMGTCDIITDLLLVVYPIPIVLMSAMPTTRKISLVLLFVLSLALVAITAYRVPSTIRRGNAQQYRSLLASLEILAAAGVSNSIVIGSFIRDRGTKKPKYRRESSGGTSSLERTLTKRQMITHHHFGSDSDLVGDVGMCLPPELRSRGSSIPSTAAQPVLPLPDHSSAEKGEMARRMAEDDVSSISTDSTDLKHDVGNTDRPAEAVRTLLTLKKMSFFDVGSLMQSDEKVTSSPFSKSPLDTKQSSSHSEFARYAASAPPQPQPRRPSQNDSSTPISDIGGLLSTTTTRTSTDLDRSTALLPPAAHEPSRSRQQQPAPPPPPSAPPNFSRGASAYSQDGRSNSRSSPQQPPPPPSYRPRRESETTQWNGAGAASSMDIADAGGLLK